MFCISRPRHAGDGWFVVATSRHGEEQCFSFRVHFFSVPALAAPRSFFRGPHSIVRRGSLWCQRVESDEICSKRGAIFPLFALFFFSFSLLHLLFLSFASSRPLKKNSNLDLAHPTSAPPLTKPPQLPLPPRTSRMAFALSTKLAVRPTVAARRSR